MTSTIPMMYKANEIKESTNEDTLCIDSNSNNDKDYHDPLPNTIPSNTSTFWRKIEMRTRVFITRKFWREIEMRARVFITKPVLEWFFFILIIINSIMMGIGTFDFVTEDQQTNYAFHICDLVFLSLFTIELVITIFYWKQNVLSNGWVTFDFLIISISWIMLLIDSIRGSGSDSSGIQVVRSLRIFRLINKVESWKSFMNAVGHSLSRLGCLAVFTSIIIFIFAVFFTEEYKHMYKNGQTEVDYFSRLDLTFFTMYQLLTLDNWIGVLREVMEVNPLAWIPFLIYISLASIIIVNLAIAIICDSIFKVLQRKEDIKKKKKRSKNLEYLGLIKSRGCELRDQLTLSKLQQAENSDANGDKIKENESETLADVQESVDMEAKQRQPSISSVSVLEEGEVETESVSTLIRGICGQIVNHKYVQRFIVLVIVVNTIILALGTFDFVAENPFRNSAFNTVNIVFLVIYTVENLMQLIFHGPRKMFSDGWLTFDFILILFSWALSLTPAFRTFRILRLIRVVPKFEAMREITGALFYSLPKISAVAGILAVFFYSCGIMFTNLFKDLPVGENGISQQYFTRLDRTLLTLFQFMTMENWAEISRDLLKYDWWAHYLVSTFLTISGLLTVNAIVALICESYHQFETESNANNDSQSTLDEKRINDTILEIELIHDDILNLLEVSDVCLKRDISNSDFLVHPKDTDTP